MKAQEVSRNQVFKYDNGVVIRQYDFVSDTFRRIEFIECVMYQAISYSGSSQHEDFDVATCLNREGKPELLLIDGNRARGFDIPTKTVIKGDALIPQIAAASILAKVERDRYCLEMAEKYPEYAFEKHKGYPTELHRQKVVELGPCPEHRMSFLKKYFEKKNGNDAQG